MGVGKKGSSSILVQVDGTYIYSHSNDRASILYSTRAPDTPYQSLRRGSRAMFDKVKNNFLLANSVWIAAHPTLYLIYHDKSPFNLLSFELRNRVLSKGGRGN